jgi:hypothetical protein
METKKYTIDIGKMYASVFTFYVYTFKYLF